MRPPATRILRRMLLGVVALVAVAVFWTLRRPAAPPDSGAGSSGTAAEGTTIEDVSFFRFQEGQEKIQLKARSWTGQEDGEVHLLGVELTFPFVSRGEESTATVTADECFYHAEREQARFRGNVHVVTADGFELTTESLDYLGDEGRVSTKEAVQFGQGTTSGSAQGAVYLVAADRLELREQVRLRFEDADGGPATEIDATRAQGSRQTRLVNFGGGVEVRQGTRRLTSKRLQLILDHELEGIERAAAIEEVDLRVRAGDALPGVSAGKSGERRLRCRRLNVEFLEEGGLHDATASNNASLELQPGPADPPEKRRMEARQIRFHFNEEGRLHRVRARDWGRPGLKGQGIAVLSTEPVEPGNGVTRRVECKDFDANLDPVTGTLLSAEFRESVVFREPGRTGWAERAVWDEDTQLLQMTEGSPRIQDEEDGSELQAQRIELSTATHAIVAVEGVSHTIRGRDDEAGQGMLGGSEPTVLVCQRFEYDPERKTAHYRENALLRAGRDEVRAPLIVLEDPAPGERQLRASGGVASTLFPRGQEDGNDTAADTGSAGSAEPASPAEPAEPAEPAPVETRSQEMVYKEEARRVVYTGDVQIRQGDILTISPEAVVTLNEAGNDVESIVAGEPVEVHQGPRRAQGQTGTYTPATETMRLEGEQVVLQDVDREVRGRVLTFKVGEDRIRVDGREEVRTEAIFTSRERPKP